MTLSGHKKYFTQFLSQHEGKLHFAAHSHHFWPDVTREAQLAYWDDCAKLSDDKWGKVFGEVIPKAQRHIARILKLKHPEQIVFAPNTHELNSRILSLFLGKEKVNILTTSSEFYSWKRQLTRLSEHSFINVELVATKNVLTSPDTFIEGVCEKLQSKPDLLFLSQVFFDSGLALTEKQLQKIISSADKRTIIVVDGYHGFAAIPTDLSQFEGRIFYLSGGYKYAMAGEGVGFMVVPKGDWRPAYTGWFAEFGDLSKPADKAVGYSSDGMAFMGATQDPSGLYRFNAAWDLFQKDHVSIELIHQHVLELQKAFLKLVPPGLFESRNFVPLFSKDLAFHGHFLTFEASNEEAAKTFESQLKSRQILIDRRGARVRFGFGLYQNMADLEALTSRLLELLKD